MIPQELLPTFDADFPLCSNLYSVIGQDPNSRCRTPSAILHEFATKIGHKIETKYAEIENAATKSAVFEATVSVVRVRDGQVAMVQSGVAPTKKLAKQLASVKHIEAILGGVHSAMALFLNRVDRRQVDALADAERFISGRELGAPTQGVLRSPSAASLRPLDVPPRSEQFHGGDHSSSGSVGGHRRQWGGRQGSGALAGDPRFMPADAPLPPPPWHSNPMRGYSSTTSMRRIDLDHGPWFPASVNSAPSATIPLHMLPGLPADPQQLHPGARSMPARLPPPTSRGWRPPADTPSRRSQAPSSLASSGWDLPTAPQPFSLPIPAWDYASVADLQLSPPRPDHPFAWGGEGQVQPLDVHEWTASSASGGDVGSAASRRRWGLFDWPNVAPEAGAPLDGSTAAMHAAQRPRGNPGARPSRQHQLRSFLMQLQARNRGRHHGPESTSGGRGPQ